MGTPTSISAASSAAKQPSAIASDEATSANATAAAKATVKSTVKVADTALSSPPDRSVLKLFSPETLAQALAEQLAIAPNDWHRLNTNRAVRAREQAAAALVYMLKDKPEEALPRLAQAIGWLDKTLKAPPCPSHGPNKGSSKGSKMK